MHRYWVYIMTNANNTVLYTGVTNDLRRRVGEHKVGLGSKFTSKYRVTKLVYYEEFGRIGDAIIAEKRIKAGSRKKKIQLIEAFNPERRNLMGSRSKEILDKNRIEQTVEKTFQVYQAVWEKEHHVIK